MSAQRAGLATAVEEIAQVGEWVCLTDARVSEEPELLEMIDSFTPVDKPAGGEAARWLRDDALASGSAGSTRTWMCLDEGKIQGFAALCATSVEFAKPALLGMGLSANRHVQGSMLVAQAARHRESGIDGRHLIAFSFAIAREISETIGCVALVLDPADPAVEKVWKADPYYFHESETTNRNGLKRLYLPLEFEDFEV